MDYNTALDVIATSLKILCLTLNVGKTCRLVLFAIKDGAPYQLTDIKAVRMNV